MNEGCTLMTDKIKEQISAFVDDELDFKETDLLDTNTAARLRNHVLSKGNTRPGMELYINFRGRPPMIEPLLERRGLN